MSLPSVLGARISSALRNPRRLLRSALIVAAYLCTFTVLDLLAREFEELPGVVAWYPAAGLGFALVLVFGARFAPALAIASLISSFLIYRFSQPPAMLLLWAFFISSIYGATAALLRRRMRFDWHLRRLRDVTYLVFAAALLSAVLAVLSVSGSLLDDTMTRSEAFRAIFNWWVGETVGVLTVTPFLLVYVLPWLRRFAEGWPVVLSAPRSFPRPALAATGQAACLVLALYWAFGAPVRGELRPLYVVTLPLIWIALQHGFKRVTAAIMGLNAGVIFAIWLFGFDFARLSELELLMIGNCVVGLTMGAVVTERRQAEAALEKSEESFRALIENAVDLIVVVEPDGTGKYVSPSVERMLGFQPEEIVGRNIADFVHPDDLDAALGAIAASLQTPGVADQPSELRVRHKDGCFRTIEVIGNNLQDSPGVSGIVVNARDITERRQAEEMLRASEDRYQALVNLSPDAIVVNVRGKFVFANPAAARLLGADSPREIVGKDILELIYPDDRELVGERTAQVLAGSMLTSAEIKFMRLDGSPVQVEATAARIEFDGSPATQVVARDITERKQAEEALRQTEEQLRQSQKMEAVGQLAGGIAHDFNNLLTAIIGYSDMILASGASSFDDVRPDVEEIKHAGERASALTKQILAFSRRQALQPEVVSLNEVLAGMEPLLRRTLGEDIDLVTALHPDLGQAKADVHQFEQVLMNLAVNARDAMPHGGHLTLGTGNVELDEEYCCTHPYAEPGSYVMLAVSDTGIGMDEATLEHIFEPFFTTKGPGEGTGLGLATVYGIVKQSGGSVSVYSEPGKGTSFKIYLPRVDASIKARSTAPVGSGLTGGQETILVVEDEPGVRDLVARILKGIGYELIITANSDEALSILEDSTCSVDMLLTDVVLRGAMQGNELAQAVGLLYPHLPVLYMSGYARDAIVHSGRLDEGVNYLEKPFTPDGLAHRVREVLDRQAAAPVATLPEEG
jgi:PAS domain S-box-containing protein